MKKLSFVFSFVLLLFFASTSQAQNNETYFIGKWDIRIVGLPEGDKEALVKFEKKDGKLTGTIMDKADKQVAAFTTVEQKDSTVVVKFDYTSGEVRITLVKKDDKNLTGELNGQFDIAGIRQKED